MIQLIQTRHARASWLRSLFFVTFGLSASIGGCTEVTDVPSVATFALSPNSVGVSPGGTVQFSTSATLTNGNPVTPDVSYIATGGFINAEGLFTAGFEPGTFFVLATTAGSNRADTSVVNIIAAPPVLLSISLAPDVATLTTGATLQFSVVGTWNNSTTSSTPVTYSATGGTIDASGLFTAGATPGAARVIATQTGGTLVDTAFITIVSPPLATPVLNEDFSTYTSTANFHSDPRNIYANEEFGGPWGQWNRIELDTTTGIADIGAGTSRKSMKFTWPNRENATGIQPDAPRCADFYIIKRLPLAPVQEVWAEFYVKFSSNWTSRAPASWNCTSNPDYKFIFLTTSPGSRFSLKNDYAGLGTRWDPTAPTQGDGTNNFTYDVWHDDRWHRIRIHAKVSVGGSNGIHRVWLDDNLVYSRLNISTGTQTAITALSLGNNMNQGPGQVQTLHWGLIRAYTTNPGW